MVYATLPDRRIPYDIDGTVVGIATGNGAYTNGIGAYLTTINLQEMQDDDVVATGVANLSSDNGGGKNYAALWYFFPERRLITGLFCGGAVAGTGLAGGTAVEGSNDSGNGVDGTWETASMPSGTPFMHHAQFDIWRTTIKPVSFTGGKATLRLRSANGGGGGGNAWNWYSTHIYGEKAVGQTPDDLIYIDHDTTPGVEYGAPEDFGDRPLGTTVTRQFRLKNTSASLAANTVTVQCNDTDFIISTDGVTWAVTLNIASIAAGAETATLYIRNTTPAPGGLLGPRFARIVTTVGSWA
jgi:hypothetical protein